MKSIIEAAWNNRELLKSSETIEAIETVIEAIDKGELRRQNWKGRSIELMQI